MKRNIRAGKRHDGGVSFSLLGESEKAQIHASTLEVLWWTGIFVEDEEALEIFDGGGAVVDPKTKNVKIPRDCSEVIIESARAGMIAQTLSQGMAGGSSPITLAGTLVIHNAEVLSGLVLSQLTHKGAPFFYCSSTCGKDSEMWMTSCPKGSTKLPATAP